MEGYISVAEAAEKWSVSKRAVQIWIKRDLLEGVAKVGNVFLVPADAERPADGRKKKPPQKIIAKGGEIEPKNALLYYGIKKLMEKMDPEVLENALKEAGMNVLSIYLELADRDLVIE